MPFGSDPFRDRLDDRAVRARRKPQSPMPFGSDPFRDKAEDEKAYVKDETSPMPFGSDPFRDPHRSPQACQDLVVTNAFRQ